MRFSNKGLQWIFCGNDGIDEMGRALKRFFMWFMNKMA
jgi:hypothetical protein